MDEKIKNILRKFFKKYEVSDEAINGAAQQIAQLLSNPMYHKTGATVMTEAASHAGDKGAINKDAKPEVM